MSQSNLSETAPSAEPSWQPTPSWAGSIIGWLVFLCAIGGGAVIFLSFRFVFSLAGQVLYAVWVTSCLALLGTWLGFNPWPVRLLAVSILAAGFGLLSQSVEAFGVVEAVFLAAGIPSFVCRRFGFRSQCYAKAREIDALAPARIQFSLKQLLVASVGASLLLGAYQGLHSSGMRGYFWLELMSTLLICTMFSLGALAVTMAVLLPGSRRAVAKRFVVAALIAVMLGCFSMFLETMRIGPPRERDTRIITSMFVATVVVALLDCALVGGVMLLYRRFGYRLRRAAAGSRPSTPANASPANDSSPFV